MTPSDPHRARTLRRTAPALLLSAAMALTGCRDNTPAEGTPADVRGEHQAVSTDTGLAGLYVTNQVTITAQRPGLLKLASTASCADLDAMLSSGQWRVVDR